MGFLNFFNKDVNVQIDKHIKKINNSIEVLEDGCNSILTCKIYYDNIDNLLKKITKLSDENNIDVDIKKYQCILNNPEKYFDLSLKFEIEKILIKYYKKKSKELLQASLSILHKDYMENCKYFTNKDLSLNDIVNKYIDNVEMTFNSVSEIPNSTLLNTTVISHYSNKQENDYNKQKNDYNNVNELLIKDIEKSIDFSINLNDDELLYDSDKVRANMYKTLSTIDFDGYRNMKNKQNIMLLPKEILFMHYLENRKVKDFNYPLMWYYTYDLNFIDVFDRLFNGGYITFGDINNKLPNLTIPELKDLLRQFKLKVSGNKKVLIDRLLLESPRDELEGMLVNDVFALTDIGRDVLSSNKHIMYFHQKDLFITIDEADKVIKEHPGFNHYSVALYILNDRLKRYINKSDKVDYTGGPILYHKISLVYQDMEVDEKELFYLLVYYCHCMTEFYMEEPPKDIADRIVKLKNKTGITMYELSQMTRKIKNDFKFNIKNNVYDTYMNALK